MAGSKFKGIFEAAKARSDEATPDPPPAEASVSAASPAPPASGRPVGRPRGKRSNPDYEQISAYLRRDTYRAAKIKLLQRGDERDISEVLEELLAAWVRG